jgi:leucine-rich repeat-containing G protein-coupled receptor 5
MKCFNATLRDITSDGGPNLNELMIFQSRIENIPDRLFPSYSAGLISLSMHDCGIREVSDYAFNALSHLRKLSLAYNNITSVRVRWFAELLSLRQLDLSYNLIASIEPAVFEKLRGLQRLDVRGNRLMCLESAQLVPMAGLEKLHFSGNPLSFRCRGTVRTLCLFYRMNLSLTRALVDLKFGSRISIEIIT